MRFRSLTSFPSFGAYVMGHTLTKTLVYGLAADLGRSFDWMGRMKAKVAREERMRGYKWALMEHGILPWPGQRVKRPISLGPRPAEVVMPTRPPDERAIHRAPKPAVKVKQVLPHRHAVADPRQTGPAAVSRTGGLRGSAATRWKR